VFDEPRLIIVRADVLVVFYFLELIPNLVCDKLPAHTFSNQRQRNFVFKADFILSAIICYLDIISPEHD
jgi:hypothetical protein